MQEKTGSEKETTKNLLFNPGPTNVSDEVRNSIATKDICHREKEFQEVLLRVNGNLVKILNGEETHTSILFASSGTGCNEAICASIHGKVLVINNGKYSDRICDILDKYKIQQHRLKVNPLIPIDVNFIEQKLREDPEITHIYLVHHETTTGMLAPLREIGHLASKYEKIFCVDSISSLGGHEFDLQKDNIDFCSVSANKCLESFPGVSFVIAKDSELQKLEGKSRSLYFDLYNQCKKESEGETPFTPPVQLIYAVDKAINEFLVEGYESRIERYKSLAETMRNGLRELGFELILFPERYQSNILTTIKMPEGFDYWKVHDKLKERGITIYSDKGVLSKGKFRVATLGHITSQDVKWFLQNLNEVIKESDSTETKTAGKTAIILAAGMGTRFGEETKELPKHLLEIDGKSLLEISLENLRRNNISEVVIIVGYQKEKIINKIGSEYKGMHIKYVINDVYDTTSTAVSFLQSRRLVDKDAILVLGDLVYEPEVIESVLKDERENSMFVLPKSLLNCTVYVSIDDNLNLINITRGIEYGGLAYGVVGDIYKFSKNFLNKLFEMIDEEYKSGKTDRRIEDAVLNLSKIYPVKCIRKNLLLQGINIEEDFDRARNEVYPKIKEKLNFSQTKNI